MSVDIAAAMSSRQVPGLPEGDVYEPALAALRRRGIRITPAQLSRWLRKGLAGGVKLPVVKILGRLYTSQRLVDDFIAATNPHLQVTVPPPPTHRQRQSAIARAERELAAEGI